MKIRLLFLVLFLFAGMFGVNAQIKTHQKIQHHRVKSGIKNGEITKGEKKVLQYRRKEIRQDAKLAKSDGKVTRPERKMIRNEQKRNSKLIYKTKHNNRDRK